MKKIYWILAFLITGVALWFLFFWPVPVTKSIQVPYTMFKSGEQINNIRNLVKWYIPFTENDTLKTETHNNKQFIQSGEFTAEIGHISPFSSIVTAGNKKKKTAFSFTASPDTTDAGSSLIKLSYHTNLFRKWFSKTRIEKNAEQSLENLKEYMMDTRRFYGYEIQVVPVEDTTFLFSRITVPLTERKIATKKLFEKLISFAEKNNAGYNGTRIFYSQKTTSDITLFASIGVTNIIEIPANSDIEYKRMPYQKNLLMATYQGPFGESHKAFRALENFKADHSMTSMAIPFQKFMSDGYDFDDEQVVQLRVYYPIF